MLRKSKALAIKKYPCRGRDIVWSMYCEEPELVKQAIHFEFLSQGAAA